MNINLRRFTQRSRPWLALVSLAVFLLGWEVLVRLGDFPAFILPSPARVWARFLSVLLDGTLPRNAWVTLQEVLLGLLLGAGLASLLGYGLARWRWGSGTAFS